MFRPILAFSAAALAAPAFAQTPIYLELPPGSTATDVTVAGGDVIVVGENAGGIFRWTFTTGAVPTGESTGGQGQIKVSEDGTRIGATISAGVRAAIWTGGTSWLSSVGIGTCSSDESTAYGLSGDGNTIAGLGWLGCSGRAWKWSQAGGAVNLGGAAGQPPSRLNDINYDGTIAVGWKDAGSGIRYGSRWVGATQSYLTYTGPGGTFALGEAFAVNSAGTKVCGYRVTGTTMLDAWLWDSTTGTTLLPNLPGLTTQAQALDLTNDGTKVVGTGGFDPLNPVLPTSLIWINNQPQSLLAYLTSLGTTGIGGYTSLGLVNGISRDGGAICGNPFALFPGQPPTGWVVIFPGALQNGTKFCSGDGTATACPCGNNGAAGHGCANSVNSAGAELLGSGFSSITGDTLRLTGSGMPNAPALYFQGTAQFNGGMGAVFGDGLRCAGGTVVRLGTKTNTSGTSHYPAAGDQSVSVRGNVMSAGTRTYQVWYRNAASFCSIATYNLSNGLEITWTP